MGSPIVHFDLMGPNPMELASFYERVFGWKTQYNPAMNYGNVDTQSGQSFGGGIAKGDAPGTGIAVGVSDIEATLALVQELAAPSSCPSPFCQAWPRSSSCKTPQATPSACSRSEQ